MKNIFVLFFVLALSLPSLRGQSKAIDDDSDKAEVIKRFTLSPVFNFSTFQNTNFSSTSWSGAGAGVDFGFEKSTENYHWEIGLELPFTSLSASSHEGSGNIINPNFHFAYLRPLNDKLAIGGRWDIMDFYLNSRNDLGNNSDYNLQTSTLFASAIYQTNLRAKQVWAGLHLGLLSFNREGTGFAFSTPQNVLEDGDFNYQNEAIDSPFGFKYYELDFLSSYLNLRTSIGVQLTKRSSISYEWQMRHFNEIKGYPTTTGQHLIKFNFALVTVK